MKIQNKIILASILFVLISFVWVAVAQGGSPPTPDPGPPLPGAPPGLPIDGGVLISVLVGVCYGSKKLLNKKG